MRMRFEFVHVEHLVDRLVADPGLIGDRRGFSALQGALTYRELMPTEPLDPDTSCLLGTGDFGLEMARIWRATNSDNLFQPSGSLEFRNFVIFGSCGLLLDLEYQIALVGGAVNWGVEYARYYVRTCPPQYQVELSADEKSFEVNLPDVIPVDPRPGLLMMNPGHDIFGHWLLDYAPRLMLAGLMHGPATPRYHFHAVPHWAPPILSAFGVSDSAIIKGPRPEFLRFPIAAMPTGTKSGFRVFKPINRMAWLRLKYALLDMPLSGEERARLPGATRVFVSRSGWARNERALRNAERLEDLARARGFVSIRPEEFSLPAQARIFRQARIVVGEDGSGLHNVIFSEPGCVLGVISVPDRINLWHMAICQNLGHLVCYVGAQIGEDDVRIVNEAEYSAMIDRLIATETRA